MKDNRGKTLLTYFTLVVVSLFFLFWGLVKAESFLAPLSVAALLAMVVLPISRWFEKKGLNRGWASFLSDLIILLFFVVIAGILGLQVKSIVSDWPEIEEKIEPKIVQLQEFIADKTGIDVREQNQKISQNLPGSSDKSGEEENKNGKNGEEESQQQEGEKQNSGSNQNGDNSQQEEQAQESSSDQGSSDSGGGILSSAGTFLSQLINFLGTFLLIFVYIFFFLLYRRKFKLFILKLVSDEQKDSTKEIITKSTHMAQNYLLGRLLLILFLAIIYSIGLSISGVKHAILISVLAALLSLLPFIGNIIGFFLAITMAFISGSGLTGALGVAITFSVAQFIESYILEPYIVGDKVNLNPIFTIIAVVLGGAIWGVIGMLIAIPALGILIIVFEHIPVLQPYSYLFGQADSDNKEDDDGNIFTKTKKWALNKFK